jgi:sec-independent protein translocase protein TatC
MSPVTKSGKRAIAGMTITEHIAEFRKRMMIAIAAVFILGVISFILYQPIINFLQQPYCHAQPGHCSFLATAPLDGLSLRIKIAFFGGLFFSTPVIFYEMWRFITPGLHRKEKRYLIPFMVASVGFFAAGCVVAYFSFEHALRFLESIGGPGIVYKYSPINYLNLIVLMMAIFGATFEFPVILVGLELLGVVTPRTLLKGWRWALILITVMAGVFTPSGDPFSMLALAVPLVIFYFAAIGVGKLLGK